VERHILIVGEHKAELLNALPWKNEKTPKQEANLSALFKIY
jgi:hypothetical protein